MDAPVYFTPLIALAARRCKSGGDFALRALIPIEQIEIVFQTYSDVPIGRRDASKRLFAMKNQIIFPASISNSQENNRRDTGELLRIVPVSPPGISRAHCNLIIQDRKKLIWRATGN